MRLAGRAPRRGRPPGSNFGRQPNAAARSALLKGIGMSLLNNPAFVAYALACVALSCNLMFLWAYSGAARNKVRSTPNTEDTTRFGSTLSDIDPPEVARVLRAHANAQASIVPFLALGLVYVLAGGQPGAAVVYCTVFTVARWLHSWAYLGARQPPRTICRVVAAAGPHRSRRVAASSREVRVGPPTPLQGLPSRPADDSDRIALPM